MKRIVIVTSHLGYGHFARQIGLIRELLNNNVEICLVADEEKFSTFELPWQSNFQSEISPPLPTFTFDNQNRLDVETTKYSFEMMLDFDTQIREDREWERILQGSDLLINDIESFHNPIAKKLGIPILNISNFTWSDLLFHAELNEIANSISELESIADYHFKLPFSTSCSSFGNKFENKGLMLRSLGNIPKKSHSILIKQFPHDFSDNNRFVDQLLKDGWKCYLSQNEYVKLDHELTSKSDNLFKIINSTEFLQRLAQAQIYIGKTGYSTVAECAHYGTRLLYWIRHGSLEDLALKKAIEDNDMGELMESTFENALSQIERLGKINFKKFKDETANIAIDILELIN